MRSGNRRTDGVAAACTLLALVAAPALPHAAQSRRGDAPATPAWAACAEAGPGHSVYPVSRLTSLGDKALVEADIIRVFAQREKEQRVSTANLASARLSIDFLYAAGEGPARMYYYEASKTIPEASGLLRVGVSGWLRGDGGAPRSLGSKSELRWIELAEDTGGDREIPEPAPIPDAAPSLLPLGVLGRGDGQVWVLRRAAGAGSVLVYEVGPRGVRLRPQSTTQGCQ